MPALPCCQSLTLSLELQTEHAHFLLLSHGHVCGVSKVAKTKDALLLISSRCCRLILDSHSTGESITLTTIKYLVTSKSTLLLVAMHLNQ